MVFLFDPPLTRLAFLCLRCAQETAVRDIRPNVGTAGNKNRKDSPAGSAGDPVLELPCALDVTW